MEKLIKWLEESFAPKMNKINHNVWVVTLKDSIMQTLPFILLGSVFCVLTIPGEVLNISWWPNFWTPFGWTMGMLSLFVAFLVPFNLMEKKRLRKQRIIAALTSVVVFLIIISPQVIADGSIGFGHSALGAGGMFIAIFSGIYTGIIMAQFGKFSFFKEESVIPDFVRSWFDSMLPIGIVLVSAWLVVDVMHVDLYNVIQSLFKPLAKVIETPYGFVILNTVYCLLYAMGISSWVLTPITKPIFLAAITSNVAMAAQGISGSQLNLVTTETINSAYMWVGGMGCTMPLLIMLMRSKSTKLKALGTASFVPGIFNINEPLVFGCIAWNPIMMIPMVLQGVVLSLVVWIGTKVIPFAPIPKIVFDMWYAPFPISTWLTTSSVNGLVLLGVVLLVSTLIWYPFFKLYEKTELENEKLTLNK